MEALALSGGSTASFVAVDEGVGVIGHALISPVAIDGPGGRTWADGLGPVAVLPEFQRSGVGRSLVRHGLEALARTGRRVVVVLGQPEFFSRFGFCPAQTFGLECERSSPGGVFMALPLAPRALDGCAGIVRYRPEMMGFRVSFAEKERLCDLQSLERLAASRFRGSEHPAIESAPPLASAELERIGAQGGLWVATKGPSPSLAAYIAWETLDDAAYVVEVDVHPDFSGARLGAALLDHVALLAERRGLSRLLLRTFSDVPWNAPYYRRLGFQELVRAPKSLEAAIRHEIEMGLDPSRRVTMTRPLTR